MGPRVCVDVLEKKDKILAAAEVRTPYRPARSIFTMLTPLQIILIILGKIRFDDIILFNFFITNLMHKILVSLHIIHLLKSSTCLEDYSAHLQEVYVVIVYMQSLVSSLSAGDCLVQRLKK